MDHDNDSYIPALRYRWLTRFYDPTVAITSREKVFKKKLLRLSFYLVQILDGFDVTRDNVQGRLPELITTAGFDQVEVAERITTLLGTLDLITATST